MNEGIYNRFEQKKEGVHHIEEVQMSLRLAGLLRSKELLTLEAIVEKGREYFSQEHIPGFAPKDLKELETIFEEQQLRF